MNKQYDNFIKILNTALTEKTAELEEADFQELSELAFQQDIAPIFLEGAVKYPEFAAAPLSVKAHLIDASTKAVVNQTQNTAEFCSIYSKLLSAGLRPIVLKGLICRKAYGKLENHRVSGDEDFYVSQADFPICHRILEENGFKAETENGFSERFLQNVHTVAYKSDRSALRLEVHLSLFGNQNTIRKAMNRTFEKALKSPYSVKFDGFELFTLDPTDHYTFLLLHYLKHFMTTGAGIRHIADLAVFGNKYKESIDFPTVEKKLTEFIDGSFYADTVALMRLLGGEEETSFSALSREALCDDLMDGGTFGYDDRKITYASTFIFSKTGGSRFALMRSVFPSYSLMSSMYPELYDKPWKLPSLYCKRISRYVKTKREPELEKDAIKKGNARINLIKNYGLKRK